MTYNRSKKEVKRGSSIAGEEYLKCLVEIPLESDVHQAHHPQRKQNKGEKQSGIGLKTAKNPR